MSSSFDLMVIGTGVAGTTVASACVRSGMNVAIVDKVPYGGTCALRGCDPKKILRRGAEIVDSARLMRGKGIDDAVSIDWAALMTHKREFTEAMPQRIEDGLTDSGVTTVHGSAHFIDPHRLEINGESYESAAFVIAAGARPRDLSFTGHEHVVDSSHFLDLDDLPERILFIGGGFISFEFAHIAARAGSSTMIVHHSDQLLKAFDPDLVGMLAHRSGDVGIDIRTDTAIRSIERDGATYRVEIVHQDDVQVVTTDLVVHGAGRVPDLDGLHLDNANVAWSSRGVTVGEQLRSTTHSSVYAAGDAADSPGLPLTPVAQLEAQTVSANLINGSADVPNYTGIPSVVFTVPELARVGLLESEAADQGINVEVRFSDTSSWFSNFRVGETSAAAKILVDKDTDRIMGAHLLGPGCAEQINLFAIGMQADLTAKQLASMTTAYPSVGHDIASLL